MARARSKRDGRGTLILVLAGISAAAWLLPTTWTGKLISLVQVLVPFQHAVSSATEAVAGDGDDVGGSVPGYEHAAIQRENEALRHRLAALSLRNQELEGQVQLLEATRQWEVDGRSIGARGRLIPAHVVTKDLLAWRSSRLINAGTLQGVSRGDAVASQHFSIDGGEGEGVRDGMAILLGEALVGLVDQAGTHASRVKMLSDVSVEMKVRIGRFSNDQFALDDGYYWLVGKGGNRMEIRDVEKRDVDAGSIAVNDVVVSDPRSELLPTALVIGRVVEIDIDRKKPLFAVLSIEAAADLDTLQQVYVYDPSSGS